MIEAHVVNKACMALGLGLAGMTQQRWDLLTPKEKESLQDLSGLTPQLIGYEGYRVQVLDKRGQQRRFWVGRSTGWRPCHLEIARTNSSGGMSADKDYQSVVIIRSSKQR
jgi:hypothetical protein